MSVESLKDTIVPKSDQLNADDLITGPVTVQITSIKRGNQEQPISMGISGGFQPYKPCKSMRRVMIAIWGDNGHDWVGRWLTLFCDPSVKFGGVKVGGIRISHMSGITAPQSLMLTTTRSKRAEFIVQPLVEPQAEYEKKVLPGLEKAAKTGKKALEEAFALIPGSSSKNMLWSAHGERLKQEASNAEASNDAA